MPDDVASSTGDVDKMIAAAGGKAGGAVSGMMSAVKDIRSAAKAEENDPQVKRDLSDISAAADKARAIEPMGEQVKPWDAKKELEADSTSPIETFGSVAMVFAQLASAFTRQPMINSLNAGAAVMKAVKERDEDTYNKAYDAWEKNTDLAFKRHQIELDDLRVAMEAGDAALRAHSARYQNKIVAAQAELGGYEAIGSYYQAQQQMGLQWAQLKPVLEEYDSKQKLAFSYDQQWLDTPEGRTWQAQHPKEKGAPESVHAVSRLKAEKEWATAKNPYRSLSMSAEEGQAVENLVAKGVPRDQAIRLVMGDVRAATTDAKNQAAAKSNKDISDEIGGLIAAIRKDPTVVGTRGIIKRGIETMQGVFDPTAGMETPASQFASKMTEVREKVSANITGSKYYSPRRQADMERILPGLEGFTSPQQALNSLIQLKAQLDAAGTENADAEAAPTSSTDYSHLWTK